VSEESSEPEGARRWWVTRRWWLIGAAVVVVAGLVWLVAAGAFGGGPGTAGPVASPTASQNPNPTATPVPEPSIASPTATGSPTVVPTRQPTSVETGLDGKVETTPGVTASVKSVEAVKGVAHGPGEIAGPALRVTVSVKNGSDKSIRTELGLINVYYGKDRTPAGTLSGPGAEPFPGEIPAGGSGTGTAVFSVPSGSRGHIEVEFSYSTDAPVVIFSGAA
jgi:hypothetical protein